ncbi:MAG: hypothetical protein IJ761_03415 [Bacteroidales bacterium]|nr:hypothetical protein [Bacteroidales bacterium]
MMNYAIFVVLALALGIFNALLIKENAECSPVRPSQGLGYSLFMAVIFSVVAWMGIIIGDLLMFPTDNDSHKTNKAIAVGLLIATAMLEIAPFIPKNRQRPMVDLSRFPGFCIRVVAQALYVMLSYIALGLVGAYVTSYWVAIFALSLTVFLLSWIGFMFGRQKVALRVRRWALLAFIFFVADVVAIIFYS